MAASQSNVDVEKAFEENSLQSTTAATPAHRRLKALSWIPNSARNHSIAFLGEFVGTFLFLFFAFAGTQVANTAASNITTATPALIGSSDVSVVLFIALSFGFSLMVNAWVFFRISGGLFNPAVTLALCLIGGIKWARAVVVFIAQVIGAIVASAVVLGLFPGDMAVRTSLGQNTSVTRGLFIEMFATFQLVFTIIMLAAEKHKSTYLAPIGIGLSLFISEMGAVPFTGGSLNPARSFGPSVVLGIFDGYHWIYWLGPALGSLLAVLFYRLVKVLEYETANPGQDFDDQEDHVFRARTFADGVEGEEEPISKEEVRRPVVGMEMQPQSFGSPSLNRGRTFSEIGSPSSTMRVARGASVES